MKRSILSVFLGYLTMVVGVSGGLGFAALLLLGELPTEPGPYEGPASFLYAEVAIGLASAIAGGYVCAWVAPRRPMRHAAVLIGLLVVFGGLSVVLEAGLKPLWSALAMPVVGAAGVWLGARLRTRDRED